LAVRGFDVFANSLSAFTLQALEPFLYRLIAGFSLIKDHRQFGFVRALIHAKSVPQLVHKSIRLFCPWGQGRERLQRHAIQWMLADLGRRAGVEVTPHTLRHSFAKNLIDAGVKMKVWTQVVDDSL
jgi:integrase